MTHDTRKPRRPHPVLAFVLIAALALAAALSLAWTDMVTKSADALNVQDTSALLPK